MKCICAIILYLGLVNLNLLDSHAPESLVLQSRPGFSRQGRLYFTVRCPFYLTDGANIRLRGGYDSTKSMVVASKLGDEVKTGKELSVDSFWNSRGLSDVAPWMISDLDQKRQNKTLTSFEADLDNLLILERKLQRNKKLRLQYNGSVLEQEVQQTEANLDALYSRIAAAEAGNQARAVTDLRQAAENALRRRDALARLQREVAMERRYGRVKQVVLRDDKGRAELTVREHSRWLDLVDGPGMDDGTAPHHSRRRLCVNCVKQLRRQRGDSGADCAAAAVAAMAVAAAVAQWQSGSWGCWKAT
jgi:hypothetical protein